jgi:hypothetical protein
MADDFPRLERLREAQRAARPLQADGERWLVYELRPLPFDRRGVSLIFESDSAIRRVRNFHQIGATSPMTIYSPSVGRID